jgi:hypothetical protein
MHHFDSKMGANEIIRTITTYLNLEYFHNIFGMFHLKVEKTQIWPRKMLQYIIMFKEPISKYVMFQESSNRYGSLQCLKTLVIMSNDWFKIFSSFNSF